MSGRIVTPCPACGASALIVGAGGYLTCGLIGCPDPGLIDRLLSDPFAREHVVTFDDDGWSVQHPLAERGENLAACGLHSFCAGLAGPPVRPGRYVADRRDDGSWSWREVAS